MPRASDQPPELAEEEPTEPAVIDRRELDNKDDDAPLQSLAAQMPQPVSSDGGLPAATADTLVDVGVCEADDDAGSERDQLDEAQAATRTLGGCKCVVTATALAR
jgi:hypothetical protein